MKQEFLKWFPHTHVTIIALIIFFCLFLILLLRVTVFRDRGVQDGLARLPLEADQQEVHRG
jgi:hypothetical protein